MGNCRDRSTASSLARRTQCSNDLRVRSVRIGDGRQEECTFLQFDPEVMLYFRRRFFIYKPANLICPTGFGTSVPLFCLFHGSFGSGLMSSVYCQFASGRTHSWQDVAYREGAILVFLESLPEPEPPTLTLSTSPAEREAENQRRRQHGFSASDYDGCWRAGPRDQDYIEAVLDHVAARYNIDAQRIYAVGHSNGGLFLSDIALSSWRFAAIVNHMGGLEPPLSEAEQELLAEDGAKVYPRMLDQIPTDSQRKVPMLIVTAPSDDNRALCENAYREFAQHQWPVTFWMYSLPGLERHGFFVQSAEVAWGFCDQAHRLGCTPAVGGSPEGSNAEQCDRFARFEWEGFLRQRECPAAASSSVEPLCGDSTT